ncbi:MAG: hypothetical protein JO276_17215 [Sphingomonadaceae bacterium]|nr:hypothetical protein [Sphingomonadaceae bacterium]
MKGIAPLAVAIIVAVVAFWLVIVLIKVTLKLVGLAIIVALAAGAYFVVRNMIGSGNAR